MVQKEHWRMERTQARKPGSRVSADEEHEKRLDFKKIGAIMQKYFIEGVTLSGLGGR